MGGVTADTLVGKLTFSSFSFTAEPDVDNNGPVTVTGDITGCVDAIGSCATDIGSQVFHLQISGSGTGTASGVLLPDGTDVIHLVDYTFSGTATTPEPSIFRRHVLASTEGVLVWLRTKKSSLGVR